MKTTAVLLPLFLLVECVIAGENPARTWTNTAGKTIAGTFRHSDGVSVWIKKNAGPEVKVALADLAPADKAAIKTLQSDFSWKLKSLVSPGTVSAPATRPAFAVSGHRKDDLCVFQTRGFEFKVDKALTGQEVGEFGRAFEASIELFKQHPWDVRPAPPGGPHYQVRLFADRRDFLKATGASDDGSAKIAGLYMRNDRVIYVPLESLRAENRSSNETLRHELTHQMMHDMLPLMPWWVAEGTAEYVRIIPWDGFGTYQCDRIATPAVMRKMGAEAPMNEQAFALLFKNECPESREAFYGNQLAAARQSELDQLMSIRAERADFLAGRSRPAAPQRKTPPFAVKEEGKYLESPIGGPRDEGRVTVLKYHAAKMLVYYLQHLEGDGKGTKMLQLMWNLRQWADEVNLQREKFEKQADEFRNKFKEFESRAKDFSKMETEYHDAHLNWLRTNTGRATDPPKPVAPEEELINMLPAAPDFAAFTPSRWQALWTDILKKSIGESPQKYYAEIIAAFKARKINLEIMEGDPGAWKPTIIPVKIVPR